MALPRRNLLGDAADPVGAGPAAVGSPVDGSALPDASTSDGLSDVQLGDMLGAGADASAASLPGAQDDAAAALDDPTLTPEDRMALQQQIEMAARRRVAGF